VLRISGAADAEFVVVALEPEFRSVNPALTYGCYSAECVRAHEVELCLAADIVIGKERKDVVWIACTA
jgi:hypothetical protein